MSSLTQTIANHFQVYVDYDKEWVPVRCPLHYDDRPSAGLNFSDKMFNCMSGCDAMPFIKLAEELQLSYDDEEDELKEEDFTSFLNQLISDEQKIKPVVIRKQIEAYANFLTERKIKPETIEEFGGYYESREDNMDYGFLAIPYGNGKFVKRRIIGEGERFRNSKGDSKGLFGRDFAGYNTVILVEGVTDYFTLWQLGYGNGSSTGISASLGAKISKEQMFLLRNKKVFILFDSDYAGYVNALKAKEYLQQFNCVVIIIEIPERFGDGVNKIDVNSAYCKYGDTFSVWLNNETNRYNSYDSHYIASTFNALSNEEGTKLTQFHTGLEQVDSILGGGFAPSLNAIAGKSGIGKSTLITYLTTKAAEQGKKVLSLSYELSKQQMWCRIASRYSQYSWAEIEKDISILEPAVINKLNNLGSLVRIELGWSIDQILAAIDSFDVIIVDYIQRLDYDGNDERIGISTNAGKLSNLARDKGKIIIMISSMPNQDTTGVMKGSGDLLYMCQSLFVLSKVNGNVCKFENQKNTRGVSGTSVYLELDYANQNIIETVPDISWIGG